jgi:hypothetical protein
MEWYLCLPSVRGSHMERREFITALVTTAVWPLTIGAQQTAKVARIGWLTAQRAPSLAPYVEAFRASLAELGHVGGGPQLGVKR